MIVGGEEETSVFPIPEFFDHQVGKAACFRQIAELSRDLEELQQPIRQICIVFHICIELSPAVLPGAKKAAILLEMLKQKVRVLFSDRKVFVGLEDGGCLGKC